MLNQTAQPNYDAELLYESLYGGTQGKILLYWSIFQFSFVGPVLMFGIVIFEMFGGDSQKRTIINRLKLIQELIGREHFLPKLCAKKPLLR